MNDLWKGKNRAQGDDDAMLDVVGEHFGGDQMDRALVVELSGLHPHDTTSAKRDAAVDDHALGELGLLRAA